MHNIVNGRGAVKANKSHCPKKKKSISKSTSGCTVHSSKMSPAQKKCAENSVKCGTKMRKKKWVERGLTQVLKMNKFHFESVDSVTAKVIFVCSVLQLHQLVKCATTNEQIEATK